MYMYTDILKQGIKARHGQFLCIVGLLVMELSYVPGILEFLGEGGQR